jgi:hypothetical protein
MKIVQRLLLAVLIGMAALHAQAAPYFASKDGSMIWDQETGLVWMRCSLGQTWDGETCAGTASKYKFSEAVTAAQQSNAAGGLSSFTDWEVPTIRQLSTLRTCSKGFEDSLDLKDGKGVVPEYCAEGRVQPTIDTKAFPNTPVMWFWSSSPSGDDVAWRVGFVSGIVTSSSRNHAWAVRLVRASQLSASEAAVKFSMQIPSISMQFFTTNGVLAKTTPAEPVKPTEPAEQRNHKIYFASKDGTMIWDQSTGLVWDRCSAGQKWDGKTCAGSATDFSKRDALNLSNQANDGIRLGGFNDWVWPAKDELTSLISCQSGFAPNEKTGGLSTSCKAPAPEGFATIDPIAFPSSYRYDYWSSRGDKSGWPLHIDFATGNISSCMSGCSGLVRFVRSTKLSPEQASSVFTNKLPSVNWTQAIEDRKVAIEKARRSAEQKAEEERRTAEAARTAAWKKLVASGAQAMYLQAGKAQRAGSVSVNGVNFNAAELYETIVDKFPTSEYAVKASDQLNAMGRTERQTNALRQADNNASNRAACFSDVRKCEASCRANIYQSNPEICVRSCQKRCD